MSTGGIVAKMEIRHGFPLFNSSALVHHRAVERYPHRWCFRDCAYSGNCLGEPRMPLEGQPNWLPSRSYVHLRIASANAAVRIVLYFWEARLCPAIYDVTVF